MTPRPVLRVALTGGIATGKSHCLKEFARLGAPTIDGDTPAKRSIGPGTAGEAAAIARFGRAIVGADGAIDRKMLARLIFRDADARRDLEAIVHPIVYSAIRTWFENLEREHVWHAASPRVGVAEIALLFETGHSDDFDTVVVAFCSPEQQLARVMARDEVPETEARQRVAAQIPITEKRLLAYHVIDTGGTVEETNKQVARIWKELGRQPATGDRNS